MSGLVHLEGPLTAHQQAAVTQRYEKHGPAIENSAAMWLAIKTANGDPIEGRYGAVWDFVAAHREFYWRCMADR